MDTIPKELASLLIGSLFIYGLTFVYSIYMAVLNHKQAKVADKLDETNEILRRIENANKERK